MELVKEIDLRNTEVTNGTLTHDNLISYLRSKISLLKSKTETVAMNGLSNGFAFHVDGTNNMGFYGACELNKNNRNARNIIAFPMLKFYVENKYDEDKSFVIKIHDEDIEILNHDGKRSRNEEWKKNDPYAIMQYFKEWYDEVSKALDKKLEIIKNRFAFIYDVDKVAYVGDIIEFETCSNSDREIYRGMVSYNDSLGFYVSANDTNYPLRRCLNIRVISKGGKSGKISSAKEFLSSLSYMQVTDAVDNQLHVTYTNSFATPESLNDICKQIGAKHVLITWIPNMTAEGIALIFEF